MRSLYIYQKRDKSDILEELDGLIHEQVDELIETNGREPNEK